VCFHALPVDGQPHPDDDETCEAASIEPDGILGMGGRDLSDVGDQPGAFVQDARNYLVQRRVNPSGV